ncbi:MBL fold metallo-hydrolase [Spirochaetia bacterium]|nr:MBL fold metallo-hydrolase [Spirochaetia bacterium]
MLSVRFWGVRGSIPTPGPTTVIFGGNTSCLEIRADSRLVIIDFGTGVKPFGDWLMANDFKKGPIDADIFITHTHWDHIMGFPLFTPLFVPTTKLRIRGPVSYEEEPLANTLKNQLSYNYWPIRLSDLTAQIEYGNLTETSVLDLGGGLMVKTKRNNHPVSCLGYRIEYQGHSIVTAYDHEPFYNLFPTDTTDPDYDEYAAVEGDSTAYDENEAMLKFFKGADVLIYDCQYTLEEYKAGKLGWGHGSYEYAINSANKAGVKKLVCFHHDPNRTDDDLSMLETVYKNLIKDKTAMQMIVAQEGLVVEA